MPDYIGRCMAWLESVRIQRRIKNAISSTKWLGRNEKNAQLWHNLELYNHHIESTEQQLINLPQLCLPRVPHEYKKYMSRNGT